MAKTTLTYYLRHYTESVREVTLDFETYRSEVNPEDFVPFFRTRLQELLDDDPAQFSTQQLGKLKRADRFLLDHLDEALQWIGQVYFDRRGIPSRQWWWWLDEIQNEGMDPPDLDTIFADYIEKAERKAARAF